VTPDLDRSIEFYTQVLGFKLARRVAYPSPGKGEAGREIAYLTLGDIMLEFLEHRATEQAGIVQRDPNQMGVKLVALRVDDMVKTLEELKDHGIEPSWGPNPGATFDGMRAEIKDPHGNSIELRSWANNDRADNPGWQPSRPGMARLA